MNEVTIWEFLKSQGMTDAGAAGVMGNLDPESGLNPKNLQNTFEGSLGYTDETYTAAVDSGKYTNFVNDKAGYGLAQWTYWSRKQNLLNHARGTGRSIGDLTMQLEFLIQELTSYGLITALRTTTSVREASDLVLLQFERPASVGQTATDKQRQETCDKRAAIAQKYYDQFATTKGDGSVMKYTPAHPPMQCFMRQSTWYKNTGTVPVKGVLIHSTAANNPTLKRYVQPDDNAADRAQMLELLGKNLYNNDWNHVYLEAGVHAFIGKLASGEVTTVQVGPWDKEAWGCGPGKYGSCNQGWIQFEICEAELSDPDYFGKIYKETIELVAYLCKLYNLDPHGTVTHCGVKNVPVILCHQDSYQYGLGCNHSDVTHWFPLHGKSMQTVRDDVAALLAGNNYEEDDDMDVMRFKELFNEMRKELQDNDCGSWSAEDRAWAISNGLIVGNGTVINGEPNYMWADFTTREQMTTLLHREEQRIMKLVEEVVGQAVEQAVLKALQK